MAAYLVPTFPIAFVWHLVLFEQTTTRCIIYSADPIIPFGLASMIIQAIIFSWVFPRVFAGSNGSVLKNGLLYGLGGRPCCHGHSQRWRLQPNTRWPRSRIMFCSKTTFTVLQFLIIGPLVALAYTKLMRRADETVFQG